MPSNPLPTIIALDFDGVICDGMIEYFQVAWRTYCQIWQPTDQRPPANLEESFSRLRPVIETGWEMPVLVRSLLKGSSETQILQDWHTVREQIIYEENLDAPSIGTQLDTLRDEWIATDLSGWLDLHRFYPGVIKKLQQIINSPVQPFIVTTKEGRFVIQLLKQQGIELPETSIFGKEYQRPKHQILQELLSSIVKQTFSPPEPNIPLIWFVEDRLKTLQSVQKQPDLTQVKLYLADWGYNTQSERDLASQDPGIKLLTLSELVQDFSNWP